jgi:hypothetical protein
MAVVLTNFEVASRLEIDGAIAVKSNFGKERVFAEIPRIALDDYFPHRPSLNAAQRHSLVESNKDIIAGIMARKCERGEWCSVSRWGSTIKQVDIDKADLFSGPRLSDARLVMEETAGFSSAHR